MTLRIMAALLPWIVLLIFSLAVYSALTQLAPIQRFFPLSVGLVGLVVALLDLATPYIRPLRERLKPGPIMDLAIHVDLPEPVVDRRAGQAFGWLLALLLAILLVGFHAGVVIFLVTYLRGVARAGWLASVVIPAAVYFIIFVVVDRVIRFNWPEPLLLRLLWG